jgi:phosphoglycolate phosphatase
VDIHLTQALIFDFDGTLVDSQKAIYQCFQYITKQLAPERIEYAKKIIIGPPLRDTAYEILGPEHQNSLNEFVQSFIKMHDEQIIENTHPYPGVTKVLNELRNKKIPMAIATNKRKVPTKKLISHFNWDDYFLFIECSDSEKKSRNKIEMISKIINENNVFQRSFFIGDTVSDGECSNSLNLRFIQALYGYGKNQNWSNIDIFSRINKISDIIKYIL